MSVMTFGVPAENRASQFFITTLANRYLDSLANAGCSASAGMKQKLVLGPPPRFTGQPIISITICWPGPKASKPELKDAALRLGVDLICCVLSGHTFFEVVRETLQ